jgi:DNA-binding response OmpR family regulator
MKDSILNGKSILAVNSDPDVLAVLEEEILEACPNCTFDAATTFKEASERLASYTYHLVVLDIMGVRGFDLMERAVVKKIPITMLTAHPFTPEALRRYFGMKAMSFLHKEKLDEIVPFLETVLKQEYVPGWKYFMHGLKRLFDSKGKSDRKNEMGLSWEKWGIYFRGRGEESCRITQNIDLLDAGNIMGEVLSRGLDFGEI